MRAPGMDDHAVADQRMNDRGAGADRAVAANGDPGPNHGAGSDQRSGADLGIGPDHRQRIDRDARFQPSGGMNARIGRAAVVSNSEDGRSAEGKSARATATKAR